MQLTPGPDLPWQFPAAEATNQWRRSIPSVPDDHVIELALFGGLDVHGVEGESDLVRGGHGQLVDTHHMVGVASGMIWRGEVSTGSQAVETTI